MSFEIITSNYSQLRNRQKLGQEVWERFVFDRNRLADYHSDCNAWYKHYRGVFDTSAYPFRSQLFIRMVYSVIETIKPRIMKYYFGQRPYINVKAKDRESYPYAEQYESAINSQYDYPDFKIAMNDWITQGLIGGLSTLALGWRYKEKEQYMPAFFDTTQDIEKFYEVMFDGPYFRCVNQRFMYYPDDNKNMHEKAYMTELKVCNKEWLEQQAEAGLLDKAAVGRVIDAAPEGTGVPEYTNDKSDKQDVGKVSDDSGNRFLKRYQLLYYYDNERNIHAIVDENTKEVLKVHPNIYGMFPYAFITPISDPFKTEGISTVETIYDIEEELNAKRNLSLDWLTLMLAPIYLVDMASGIDSNKIIRRPGAHIPTRDMAGMKPLETPAIPPDFYRMVDLWSGDIQLVTGINDYTKGIGGSLPNQTATGMNILVTEGNQRMGMMNEIIGCGIQDMVRVQTRLNMAHWRDPNINVPRSRIDLKKAGDGFIDIEPLAFWANYNYLVGAANSPDVNPLIVKQQLMEFLATISKIPIEMLARENFMPSFAHVIQNIAKISGLEPMEVLTPINELPVSGGLLPNILAGGGAPNQQNIPMPTQAVPGIGRAQIGA